MSFLPGMLEDRAGLARSAASTSAGNPRVMRLIRTIACVVGLLWFAPLLGHVRTTSPDGVGHEWVSMPIRYVVSEGGLPDVLNGSDFRAIHEAFAAWQAVDSAEVRFEFVGTVPLTAAGKDGINLISFADPVFLETGILAVTHNYEEVVDGQNRIVESDIVLNPNLGFTTSGEPGRYDLQSVMTHQIGHLLGLAESPIVSSVMSPVSAPGQVGRRYLGHDDRAGITAIYPDSAPGSATGSIQGSVVLNGQPVFGAHVVALDGNGTPMVGTLTAPDGSFYLDFLPPGTYRIYAEPMDGPIYADQLPVYYESLRTDFATTYYPGTTNLAGAVGVPVSIGATTGPVAIAVGPKTGSAFNLTVPNFNTSPPKAPPGFISVGRFSVGGVDIVPGSQFSASTPLVQFLSPVFSGRLSPTAPTSAHLESRVHPDTPAGPKNLIGVFGETMSLISGAFTVTGPRPEGPSARPAGSSSTTAVQGSKSSAPRSARRSSGSGTSRTRCAANARGSAAECS